VREADGVMADPQDPIRFIILSKNGRDISAFSYYSQEREVLFKTGTHFKVMDVQWVHDFNINGQVLSGTEIHMEELP
jgi:hypothetical protein